MAQVSSLDEVVVQLNEEESFLRQHIPAHKDIFDEVASSVAAIVKKGEAISQPEKKVFYRKVSNIFYYLLHVQGDTSEYKEKYWKDLIQYSTTYKERLEYTDGLLTIANILDSEAFSWEMLQEWETAKRNAMSAVSRLGKKPEANMEDDIFSNAINGSFEPFEKIRKHLTFIYDRAKF